MVKLEPVDPKRCQADITTPQKFMAWGSTRKTERCSNVPTHIATEKEPGADGQVGAMSVCAECLVFMLEQMGSRITIAAIKGAK